MISLVLGVVALSFWPALTGPFLFDDTPNLAPLTQLSAESATGQDWLRVIFGNASGSLGRPLSMLSFAVQAEHWPQNPLAFKLVNLCLHLFVAALLGILAWLVAGYTALRPPQRALSALFAAALWAAHPMMLPSTMLVVQRMTLLSSFAMAAALCCFLLAASPAARARGLLLWLAYPLVFGTGLLAKETAILLPIYLLVLALILPATAQLLRAHRLWTGLFVVLPLLALITYIVVRWPGFANTYQYRDFNLSERLLTESRVIVRYLIDILWPSHNSAALFRDDISLSTGWLQPVSTLACVALLAVLTAGAVAVRRRWPWLALGWLWFIGGHLLESTVLPLELAFAHRNYLPLFGITLFIALHLSQRLRLALASATLVGALLALLIVTSNVAHDYGDEEQLAYSWARDQPNSSRAQQYAATVAFGRGDWNRAGAYLQQGLEVTPESSELLLQSLIVRCVQGKNTTAAVAATLPRLAITSPLPAALNSIAFWRKQLMQGTSCDGLAMPQLLQLAEAMLVGGQRYGGGFNARPLLVEIAEIHVARGDLNNAMKSYDAVFAAKPEPDIAVRQAQLLASAGLPQAAQRYVDIANATPHPNFWYRLFKLSPTVNLATRPSAP